MRYDRKLETVILVDSRRMSYRPAAVNKQWFVVILAFMQRRAIQKASCASDKEATTLPTGFH